MASGSSALFVEATWIDPDPLKTVVRTLAAAHLKFGGTCWIGDRPMRLLKSVQSTFSSPVAFGGIVVLRSRIFGVGRVGSADFRTEISARVEFTSLGFAAHMELIGTICKLKKFLNSLLRQNKQGVLEKAKPLGQPASARARKARSEEKYSQENANQKEYPKTKGTGIK
jgi:hypothetical protein